jgi:hypothetical protein
MLVTTLFSASLPYDTRITDHNPIAQRLEDVHDGTGMLKGNRVCISLFHSLFHSTPPPRFSESSTCHDRRALTALIQCHCFPSCRTPLCHSPHPHMQQKNCPTTALRITAQKTALSLPLPNALDAQPHIILLPLGNEKPAWQLCYCHLMLIRMVRQ